jgi:hypothetical protein
LLCDLHESDNVDKYVEDMMNQAQIPASFTDVNGGRPISSSTTKAAIELHSILSDALTVETIDYSEVLIRLESGEIQQRPLLFAT